MPPRTALILDLAGELFTDLGREVILRRLAEEALGAIHSNVWKYEYIHHCNQLAWFSPGRLMACLLLERHWPRIRPYTELAIADLRASLDGVILRDGGYEEGPTYFRCVGRDGGLSFYLYAKARGVPLASVLPECMKRCGDFGEAIESTDDGNDVIPICDAGALHDMASLATMASILPAGAWGRMLRKAMGSRGGAAASKRHHRAAALADLTMALALTRSSPEPASCPKPFVFLPQRGLDSSGRVAFHRIAIGKPGRVGILTVKVRLEVFETASVPSAGE